MHNFIGTLGNVAAGQSKAATARVPPAARQCGGIAGEYKLADALARNPVAVPIKPPHAALVEVELGLLAADHFPAIALALARKARTRCVVIIANERATAARPGNAAAGCRSSVGVGLTRHGAGLLRSHLARRRSKVLRAGGSGWCFDRAPSCDEGDQSEYQIPGVVAFASALHRVAPLPDALGRLAG